MSDRDISADGTWITQNAANRNLWKHGYSVGGYIDNDVSRYVLYRRSDEGVGYERVHEFDSFEELNRMVKLLIPPED